MYDEVDGKGGERESNGEKWSARQRQVGNTQPKKYKTASDAFVYSIVSRKLFSVLLSKAWMISFDRLCLLINQIHITYAVKKSRGWCWTWGGGIDIDLIQSMEWWTPITDIAWLLVAALAWRSSLRSPYSFVPSTPGLGHGRCDYDSW